MLGQISSYLGLRPLRRSDLGLSAKVDCCTDVNNSNGGVEAADAVSDGSRVVDTIENCWLMMASRTDKMSIKVGAALFRGAKDGSLL